MQVLICGSRGWEDADCIEAALAELPEHSVIIAGGARGADKIGEELARARGLQVRVFPADWDAYGKRAGYLRNIQMLDQEPDQVWVFWDGQSRGTQHTMREARKRGIPTRVWTPAGEQASLF